jgi:mannose-6-phosphate isomerase-like protein (cupin superfamily)
MSAVVDIVAQARRNTDYRRVVHTGQLSQLVVMSLLPNDEIGAERHRAVEQTLVVVVGFGTVILDGRRQKVGPGDAIVVTPGTYHNLVADSVLKLFTIYTPPNHIHGRVHRTRAEAEADIEDQEFGRAAGGY